MRKWIRLTKNEDGAEMIEAVIIYPMVCFCIFFLLYMGLYILQSMTLTSYAQKIAVLAAREIARPGYISLITSNNDAYANGAVEMNLQDYSQEITNDNNKKNGSALVQIPTSAAGINVHAYRYWTTTIFEPAPLLCKTDGQYKEMLRTMVKDKSFMVTNGDNIVVNISTKNNIVAQYVTVSVEQDLARFPILEALGINTPKISVSARAAATDMDEFVRNTDIAVDVATVVTKKLGIDFGSIKTKVMDAVKKMKMKVE